MNITTKLIRMTNKQRYNLAHLHWQEITYPSAFKAGFTHDPPMPVVTKANGLTNFICNYLNWSGHRATRINVSGRKVKDKWIRSTTRKGTADISATINGKSVMIEIKIGRDKPSLDQLAEQIKERNAGGIYEFISSVDEFFMLYDNLL
jgi:hypothetical protein